MPVPPIIESNPVPEEKIEDKRLVTINQGESGYWDASCPSLHIATTGATYELAAENIKEAIKRRLKDMKNRKQTFPPDRAEYALVENEI